MSEEDYGENVIHTVRTSTETTKYSYNHSRWHIRQLETPSLCQTRVFNSGMIDQILRFLVGVIDQLWMLEPLFIKSYTIASPLVNMETVYLEYF